MRALLFGCSMSLLFIVSLFHVFNEVSWTQSVSARDSGQFVIVESGDTLWEIAERYQNFSDLDRWDVIHLIQQENQLNSWELYPGQTLIIPEMN